MNLKHLLISVWGLLAYYVVNSVAIIGGGLAIDQFPYQVSVQLDGKHTCGGGIIDDYHILTAAKCVISEYNNFRGSHVSIVAGTNDLNKQTSQSTVIRNVTIISVPTEYNPLIIHFSGDIAVLKLNHPLDLLTNRHLKTVKLPKEDGVNSRISKIAGFGWYEINEHNHEEGNIDSHLRFAEADVLRPEDCQLGHRNHLITEGQICARVKQYQNVRRGVCTGDIGGPLVRDHFALGVLSITPEGCNERIEAGIYTRVAHYLGFIQNVLYNKPHAGIRTLHVHH